MTDVRSSRTSTLRTWLIWTAGFLAFPLAGLAGTAVAGRVDDPVAALVGGAIAGLVIGAGQTLASRGRLDIRKWVPATGIGMGLGLVLGAVVVDYRTSLGALVLMGALTGLVLGPAQALALPRSARLRWAWAAAVPGFPVWDLGGLIGSTGWGLWVAALGVVVLMRPIRPGSPALGDGLPANFPSPRSPAPADAMRAMP